MNTHSFSELEISAVKRVIRGRRTIQNFTSDRVDSVVVMQAVELARWTPNHKLTEPWRVYLVGERTEAEIIERNTELVREKQGEAAARNKRSRWSAVPHWLVLTCLRSADDFRQKEDYAACCCFAQNMMLYLWTQGIGTKWTTGPVTRDQRFFDITGIDSEKEFVVGLFQYGIPDESPDAIRKSTENFLTTLP